MNIVIKDEQNPKVLSDRTYKNCLFLGFPDDRHFNNLQFIDCTFRCDIKNLSGFDIEFKDCDLTEVVFKEMEEFGGIKLTNCKLPPFQIVPSSGSFTGWKKVRGGYILKLLIPANAKRTSSLVGRKCRANKVKVVGVEKTSTSKFVNPDRVKYYSLFRPKFSYYVGEYITEPDYDDNPTVECTKGIHFFITKEEAINYVM